MDLRLWRLCVCVCVFVCECIGACSAAFRIYVSVCVCVCVVCVTCLSEGACGGYTNTEEGYLYFHEIMVLSVRSGPLQPDLARSWSSLNLFTAYTKPPIHLQNCANMTVSDNPSGQTLSVCSSEPTSTDGPAVLKNSPPGFYCSVVWRTVTAQGACGLDMGTASSQSSHGLAQ